MVETLQGFQADRLSTVLWTTLAGWLVWPLICGVIGASKGTTMKSALHGLCWGPIGLIVVMMAKKKYACPTCGCKSLDRELQLRISSPSETPDVLFSDHVQTGRTGSSQGPPLASPADRSRSPEPATQMAREPRRSDVSATDPRDALAQACAGYNEAEAARLLAWVNDQAAAIAGEIDKSQPASSPVTTRAQSGAPSSSSMAD